MIDDEPALRCLAEALLDDLGYSVLLAESGQAALRLLTGKPQKADAVLLDMTMPGLSAEETFCGLRGINPSLPIVVLSAHSKDVVQDRFETGTINGYLQKPYSDSDLRTALLLALPPPDSDPNSSLTGSRPPAPFEVQPLTEEEKSLMANEFLAARRLELPFICRLLKASDFDQLHVLGHTLKGSGGCFGFPQLTALGAALEHSAETSDIASCRQQISLLEDFLSDTNTCRVA